MDKLRLARFLLALALLFVSFLQAMAAGRVRPIVIAHRGASGYLPEHTLAAKALAYGMRADFIEQDVVLSKDDQPIVLHDIYLNDVTNVAEVFPNRARSDGRIYAVDLTLSEIKQLTVTERFDPETRRPIYPGRFPVGWSRFQVPTLAEEIELIQGLNKSTGRIVGIYPEIKRPDWHRSHGKEISRIMLDVLDRYGYRCRRDPIYLQCFDAGELRRLRHGLKTDLKLIQLIDPDDWNGPVAMADTQAVAERLEEIAQYADGIGPSLRMVLAEGHPPEALCPTSLVEQAHRCGLEVHPYTLRADALPVPAKDFEQLLRFLYFEAGVDGLFTDFPDRAASITDCGLRIAD